MFTDIRAKGIISAWTISDEEAIITNHEQKEVKNELHRIICRMWWIDTRT